MKRIDTSQKHFMSFKRAKDIDGFDHVFTASTDSIDSHRTVIPLENWNLERFENNGIILYQHWGYGDFWETLTAPPDPNDVIGKGTAWKTDTALMVGIVWDIKPNKENGKVNDKAITVKNKYDDGFLNSVSVGFMELTPGVYMNDNNEEVHYSDATFYKFGESQLIELSAVVFGSQPDALISEAIHQLSLANEKLRQPPHTINLTINGEEVGQRELNKSLPGTNQPVYETKTEKDYKELKSKETQKQE